jgi:hypothetical protein
MYDAEETFKALEEQSKLIQKAFNKVLSIKENSGIIRLKDFKSTFNVTKENEALLNKYANAIGIFIADGMTANEAMDLTGLKNNLEPIPLDEVKFSFILYVLRNFLKEPIDLTRRDKFVIHLFNDAEITQSDKVIGVISDGNADYKLHMKDSAEFISDIINSYDENYTYKNISRWKDMYMHKMSGSKSLFGGMPIDASSNQDKECSVNEDSASAIDSSIESVPTTPMSFDSFKEDVKEEIEAAKENEPSNDAKDKESNTSSNDTANTISDSGAYPTDSPYDGDPSPKEIEDTRTNFDTAINKCISNSTSVELSRLLGSIKNISSSDKIRISANGEAFIFVDIPNKPGTRKSIKSSIEYLSKNMDNFTGKSFDDVFKFIKANLSYHSSSLILYIAIMVFLILNYEEESYDSWKVEDNGGNVYGFEVYKNSIGFPDAELKMESYYGIKDKKSNPKVLGAVDTNKNMTAAYGAREVFNRSGCFTLPSKEDNSKIPWGLLGIIGAVILFFIKCMK